MTHLQELLLPQPLPADDVQVMFCIVVTSLTDHQTPLTFCMPPFCPPPPSIWGHVMACCMLVAAKLPVV